MKKLVLLGVFYKNTKEITKAMNLNMNVKKDKENTNINYQLSKKYCTYPF